MTAAEPDVAGGLTAPARRSLSSRLAISPPWLFSSLLTLIVVVGELFFDILGGYERIAVTLGASFAAETVLSLAFAGKRPNLVSAYITGNSVLVLTKPAAGLLWPFWMGSLIAIASKFALRYRGQHIWNPTNLSFAVLLLLAPGSVAILSHQWSNSLWAVAVLMILGFLIVSKVRLLHISGTYFVAFLVLAVLRAFLVNPGVPLGEMAGPVLAEVAPVTGPMYILFMFFMITDPRTVVKGRRGQVAVVLIIALVEMGIRLAGELDVPALAPLFTAPPIFALAIVGPIAKVVDIRRRTPAPALAA